jgi:uncharacterized protein (TIGR03086 family)
MDLIATCQQTLAGAQRMVASIRPDELAKPTPCPEWSVRHLIDHMVSVNWAYAGFRGARPRAGNGAGPPPSDHYRGGAYAASARAVLTAWRAPGALGRTLRLPLIGSVPGAQAIGFHIAEQLTHTWDLPTATGRDRTLDPRACAATLDFLRQSLGPETRGAGRLFGPAVPCPEHAPPSDRLAAFLGRAI